MKLYATTTSERASKGQGGNKYLDIIIRNELSQIIGNVFIQPDNHMEIILRDDIISDISTEKEIKIKTFSEMDKGNKQKGECKASKTFTNKYGEQEFYACTCK
jgi:hypothetical protein